MWAKLPLMLVQIGFRSSIPMNDFINRNTLCTKHFLSSKNYGHKMDEYETNIGANKW